MSRFLAAISLIFLCLWPIAVLIPFWPARLATGWYVVFLVAAALLWLRVSVSLYARKLLPSLSQIRHRRSGKVDGASLAELQEHCQSQVDGMGSAQLLYFAISVLFPASIRRRVTDEYSPNHRTLYKKVSIEFDLDERFVSWPESGTERASHEFLAVSFPRKGTLHDELVLTDAEGTVLPSLSYREYRVLAAQTLRFLLRAAYGQMALPAEALHAEALALMEIIRFERYEQETSEEYRARREEQEKSRHRALQGLLDLDLPDGNSNGPHYRNMAVQLVSRLCTRYAIVAVVPAGQRRMLVRYERTEIPSLNTAADGFKGMLRMLFGSRPVTLTVSARNAVTCLSYHLYVKAPDSLYLAEVDTGPIDKLRDEAPTTRPDPYIRVRGRRGQSYFHMYGRLMRTTLPDRLLATVKFFEVPPGSIGKSASAALAAWLVVGVVGAVVSWTPDIADVDTQVVAFLLAVPGIAAAWLGLEARQGALFEGTLMARMSLLGTFLISLCASALLLLHHADLVHRMLFSLIAGLDADIMWTVLFMLGGIHAIWVSCSWWHRTKYYRTLVAKPGDDSASMFSN